MIKITLQDTNWKDLWSFEAKKWKLITEMAKENNIEIPFSCGSGACGLCLCEVIEGMEFINSEYLNHPMMELEDNQILTCISAIKDKCFDDGKDHKIVLKRYI